MANVVTSDHHAFAKDNFNKGLRTKEVREDLMSKYPGLSKSQANDACTTARKQLKMYKSKGKEEKRRAREEAKQQSKRKTEVKQN